MLLEVRVDVDKPGGLPGFLLKLVGKRDSAGNVELLTERRDAIWVRRQDWEL